MNQKNIEHIALYSLVLVGTLVIGVLARQFVLSKGVDDFSMEGIRENQEMRTLWQEICNRKEVSLTFDLFHIGIVIFQPRFHKKNYMLYF